jgi:cobalt-zinc-cadmium efflux system outer membrane protein
MLCRRARGWAPLLALAFIFVEFPLRAQPSAALTLKQAITEAIQNNLQLIADRLQVPIADAEMIAARLRPNPTIAYEVDNLSAQRLFGTHPADTTDRTIAVGIPIETGGKRRLRIENAGYSSRIAQLQFQDAVRRLRLDVATVYSDGIRIQQRAALAHANTKLLDDVVEVNAVRVKAGAAAPLELTRAQTAMFLLRNDAARADADFAAAQLHLSNVLGRGEAARPAQLDDHISINDAAVAKDVEDAEATALAKRPDLLAARLTLEQSDSALRLAIAQSRPDPVAGLSYTRKGVADIGSSYGANVTLPLTLFDRNQGDVARARAQKEAAAAQVKALEAQVRTEVRTAWGQYRASRRIVEQIEADLIPSAGTARDTAAYVYRTHASTLLEFLDAERAYNDAMDSYFDAQAAARTAAFQLEAAMGENDNAK